MGWGDEVTKNRVGSATAVRGSAQRVGSRGMMGAARGKRGNTLGARDFNRSQAATTGQQGRRGQQGLRASKAARQQS